MPNNKLTAHLIDDFPKYSKYTCILQVYSGFCKTTTTIAQLQCKQQTQVYKDEYVYAVESRYTQYFM